MKPFLIVLVTLAAALNTARAAAGDCDRECLRGFVTRYLDAMVAHNPSALPVSEKLKFTEDTVQMRLGGGGLWKTATGLGVHRQDILDVSQGVAASQAIVEEAAEGQSHPVMLVLRLKVADGKITEVETQVTRSQKEGAIFNIGAIQAASKAMNAAPERSQLASRPDAIKLAEFYPAGLKVGSFVAVDAPFAADAYRIENGTITAGPGMFAGRLRERQDTDDYEASCHNHSRRGGGRGVGYRSASHELWRHGFVRGRQFAHRVGGVQSVRRPDPRCGSVHEGHAGERGVWLGLASVQFHRANDKTSLAPVR